MRIVQAESTQSTRRHWARRTHRVLGMSSMLFLILLSISGLLLNHADRLGLPDAAASSWVIRLYGVEVPPLDAAFLVNEQLFSSVAGTVYVDGREIARSAAPLVGAVTANGVTVLATSDELYVCDSNGALIERLVADDWLPLSRLGTQDEQAVVQTHSGFAVFDTDRMTLSDAPDRKSETIIWAQTVTPTAQQAREAGMAALGRAFSWERVLLDLHSGRILPGIGRSIADLAALALLYMCASGIILWMRRR